MLKKVLLLMSGHAFGSAVLFARNIIIARLIGVEDYGIAATFAMVVAVVEMTSQLGLQQLIVQADDGDDKRFQANMQGFNLLRCAANALLLVLLAKPFAVFMGIPEVAWAFQMLAIPRLAMGFIHFDIYRRQRHMVYWPMLWANNASYAAALLAVFPLVWVFGDYRAMLYSMILQGIVNAGVSHFVAERRYQLRLDRAFIVRSFNFGWPILLNGAVMFLVLNGEKIVVGRELGYELLAYFAMGVTLTFSPALIITRTIEGFFFPQIAAAKENFERFSALARAGIQITLLSGMSLVLATVLIVVPIIPLLLGEKYAPLVPLMIWFAVLQAMSSTKGGLALVTLAKARTKTLIYAHLCRVASLGASWWAAVQGADLTVIISIAIAGETVGFVLTQYLIRSRFRISLRRVLPGYVGFIVFVSGSLAAALWMQTPAAAEVSHLWLAGFVAILFVVTAAPMTQVWDYLRKRDFSSY